MKEKHGIKISIILTIIGVVALVTGITFAIYENTINSNKSQIIKTGVVNFTLTETTSGIVLNNLQELSDYEGMAQETYYEFSITNTGDTKTDYEIYLIDKNSTSYTGTILDDKYVKVGLTINDSKEKIVNLEEVNRLIDKVTLNVGKTANYKLRVWLNFDGLTDTEKEALVGQKIFLTLKINGIQNVILDNLDTSGASVPVLASNMIPVYYDGTTWRKADSTNKNKTYKWYDYTNKMWANAVTVTSTNRSTYVNASLGTEIPMNDINTMWVWIPRFSAVTPSNYNGGTKEAPGAIDVTFVDNETSAHDAFTFGTKNLSGFWYAKFETSHTTLASSTTSNNLGCTTETCSNANGIIIKPNVTSLRFNNVSNFFYASRSMEQSSNSFGFVSSEVDTHMSKNNEWGAVAYLTQSIYGRCTSSTSCTEVGINNNSSYITGYGAPAGSSTSVTNGAYNTDLGKDASTTGNIYGIYDMSGGSHDYVMGVYTDGTQNWSGNSSTYNSGFTGCLGSSCSSSYSGVAYPESKYYNSYTNTGTSDSPVTNYTNDMQHALIETKNWYSDNANFVNSLHPWFMRGVSCDWSSIAGVFSFNYGNGSSSSDVSVRLVITNE